MLNKTVPLCSWQYERMFNTTRVPGIETGTSLTLDRLGIGALVFWDCRITIISTLRPLKTGRFSSMRSNNLGGLCSSGMCLKPHFEFEIWILWRDNIFCLFFAS